MTDEKKTGYRLVALDMDGTLLMSDKPVHPDTVRDIEAAGFSVAMGNAKEEIRKLCDAMMLGSNKNPP